MAVVLVVVGGLALAVSYALGALSVQRHRWCPLCGLAVRCPQCPGEPTPAEAVDRCSPDHPLYGTSDVNWVSTREVEQALRGEGR